jgi:two-component system, OmpR family, response regulator
MDSICSGRTLRKAKIIELLMRQFLTDQCGRLYERIETIIEFLPELTTIGIVGGCHVMVESRRRVLVIEDDPETGKQLVESLAACGYQVDLAVSGDEGLSHGLTCAYAVVTIDRMLPGIDGIEIIRRLREDGVTTPALIISALGEVDDRVRGLRAGGDDYLVKPFAFAELLARVEALARRSATVVKETVLRVGDLQLDLMTRTVTRGGRDIDLLPREFQVLEYLVRNEGHVVPRAMLLQHVWDLHFDPTTNIIDVYVGRVRRKIDSQQAYPLIHTVRGVGFCIRAPD